MNIVLHNNYGLVCFGKTHKDDFINNMSDYFKKHYMEHGFCRIYDTSNNFRIYINTKNKNISNLPEYYKYLDCIRKHTIKEILK